MIIEMFVQQKLSFVFLKPINGHVLISGHFFQGSLSAASSPSRRFAGQGLVRLNEIESEEDLHQLSAKQCKDLLAMSRVNFHGVIEKEELLKIVLRLWKQEMKAQRGNLNLIQWGSEVRTRLDFEWLKRGWFQMVWILNGS